MSECQCPPKVLNPMDLNLNQHHDWPIHGSLSLRVQEGVRGCIWTQLVSAFPMTPWILLNSCFPYATGL